jgi:hypothetical protein
VEAAVGELTPLIQQTRGGERGTVIFFKAGEYEQYLNRAGHKDAPRIGIENESQLALDLIDLLREDTVTVVSDVPLTLPKDFALLAEAVPGADDAVGQFGYGTKFVRGNVPPQAFVYTAAHSQLDTEAKDGARLADTLDLNAFFDRSHTGLMTNEDRASLRQLLIDLGFGNLRIAASDSSLPVYAQDVLDLRSRGSGHNGEWSALI